MNYYRDIVFITFDIAKSDYPSMPYAIACLIAAINKNNYVATHYPIDVKQILEDRIENSSYKDGRQLTLEEFEKQAVLNHDVATIVESRLLSSIDYFMTFRFIALSVSRWSIEHCNNFAKHLKEHGYKGSIIFGGYEITASKDEELIKDFPNADYFTKGYAEKVYVELLRGGKKDKILKGLVCGEDLVSPYLSDVINLYSRKLYWETKRGCPFQCNFCEWGALEKNERNKVIELDINRLQNEIDLFAKSGVEELNILDGTFNYGKQYIDVFKYVMEKSCLKITLQTRYESLNDDFLDLCQKYNGRVHLEFGLQTIHKNEMETIGRKNNIEKVKTALQKLNERSISYETSIIYAIPGQTMESFIDTIEFLLVNGCKTIRAFPLELAKNSDLASKEKREEWSITTFTDPETKYCTVNSSASFYEETRVDMDLLAKRLFSDSTLFNGKSKKNGIKWEKDSVYQHIYRFKELGTGFDEQYLYSLINEYYDKPTQQNTKEIDFAYSMMQIGEMYEESCEQQSLEKHIRKVLSERFCKEIPDRSSEPTQTIMQNGNIVNVRKSIANYKFYCKLIAGESGNLYVYRGVKKIILKGDKIQ